MTAQLFKASCAAVLLFSAQGCATQAPKQAEEAKPAGSTPSDPAQMRKKVEDLLSGYERIPKQEDWHRLGPDALAALEAIYRDPDALVSRRTRAVASMGQVENPKAEETLRSIIQDPKADVQYRSTAVLALSYRLGPSAAVPQVEPLLESKEPAMRDAATKALGQLGTAEARKSLEDRLGKEEDPAIREAIQQTLTKMQP
jgi:hypothetical protein